MPYVHVNGIRLYMEEHGQGEPLLLMAPTGWPGSVWDLNQVPYFQQRYRVITYDQRGIGLSDHPDEEYTTRQLAADAVGLLRALDAAPAHVLGFSMGGRIAQWMALDAPEVIRRLVLAGTDAGQSGCGRAGVPLDVVMSLLDHGYEGFWEDHLSREFPFSPEFRAQHPDKVRALAAAIQSLQPPVKLYLRHIIARGNHDAAGRLQEIATPTLVLVGENDVVSAGSGDHVAAARQLAEAIPGAVFQTIPGARHLFPWEAPDSTNQIIDAFLRGGSAWRRFQRGQTSSSEIYGWIEMRETAGAPWDPVVQVDYVLDNELAAFEALFGGISQSGCEPLAPGRGLPGDISTQVRDDCGDAGSAASWITWAEIEAMQDDQTRYTYEPCAEIERRDADGKLIDQRQECPTRMPQELLEEEGATSWEDRGGQCLYVRTRAWDDNRADFSATAVHKFRLMRRRDLFVGRWQLLFNMMAVLSGEVGPNNVRLVAWL